MTSINNVYFRLSLIDKLIQNFFNLYKGNTKMFYMVILKFNFSLLFYITLY